MSKHPHYFKDVRGLGKVDIYRMLQLFEVTDPCLQHAIKKLMVAGGRGAGKSTDKDIQEAIDSLVRWQEMRREDSTHQHRLELEPWPELEGEPESVRLPFDTKTDFRE